MHCVIYKGSRRPDTYLFLPGRDDIAGVPDALLEAMGRLELVMELTIHPGRRLARVRAVEVLDGLLHRGCFVQLPPDDDVMPFGGSPRTKH